MTAQNREGEQVDSVSDLTAMFSRHKYKTLSVFSLLMLGALLLAFMLPATFRSTATILIEFQKLPETVVSSTVNGFVEARIAAAEKRVNTEENLWSMIEKHDLYSDLRAAKAGKLAILDQFKSNILKETSSVEVVNPKTGRVSEVTLSFQVSYDSPDPKTAQAVANELAELYIAENAAARTSEAKAVVEFLSNEVGQLEEQLSVVESNLAEYKQLNPLALPEQVEVNRRYLERAETDLKVLNNEIQTLQNRRRELQAEKAISSPGTVALAQQLREKQGELAQKKLRYSDFHPDVKKVRSEMAAIQAQIDAGQTVSFDSGGVDRTRLITINSRLDANQDQLRNQVANREELVAKIDLYEARLLEAPKVEVAFQDMLRERANLTQAFQQVKRKELEARMSVQLEIDEKSDSLKLVESAYLPESPISPNRAALIMLGFTLSLGAGIGTMVLADKLDGAVHGVQGVQQLLGAPPLAVIPKLGTVTA